MNLDEKILLMGKDCSTPEEFVAAISNLYATICAMDLEQQDGRTIKKEIVEFEDSVVTLTAEYHKK